MKTRLFLLAFAFAGFVATSFAQDLMTTTLSPDANGMGRIDATIISDNALAVSANPAQIGIFNLSNVVNAASYVKGAPWMPGSAFTGASLTASAANVGIDLRRFVKIPFDVSIGAGYSKASLNRGTYHFFQPDGTPFKVANTELLDTWSAGIGLKWLVEFSIGYTSKFDQVEQPERLSDGTIVQSSPTADASDWGALLRIPVVDVVSMLNHRDAMLTKRLRPLLNITASFAKRNIGGIMPSFPNSDTLPLPRQAVAGLALNLGLATDINGTRWELFSFTVARQAEDLLVSYASSVQPAVYPGLSPTYTYQPGLGDLRLFDNLLMGRSNGTVSLSKGWEVGVGELLYLRGGSYYPIAQTPYATIGGSIRLSGLLKLCAAYRLLNFNYGALAFIYNHLDVQYDYSEYTSSDNTNVTGSTFESINLVVR